VQVLHRGEAAADRNLGGVAAGLLQHALGGFQLEAQDFVMDAAASSRRKYHSSDEREMPT
jgi:hypothetical protein